MRNVHATNHARHLRRRRNADQHDGSGRQAVQANRGPVQRRGAGGAAGERRPLPPEDVLRGTLIVIYNSCHDARRYEMKF